jgi:hypothetical protein
MVGLTDLLQEALAGKADEQTTNVWENAADPIPGARLDLWF